MDTGGRAVDSRGDFLMAGVFDAAALGCVVDPQHGKV